ncbi:mRNA capping enzyme catalytic domain-containing protein [Penicillium taxi]|uniref:mRNA capping enzyme catalytic domain-containing protein n=1 Tax=Penicillium taxi TaxID=168475 RepID=UPI00254591D7|nr:mRNA capping enzyme catalytic domain-containing protein [Penicillium taxi]KAJ5894484.1 mRNA capping enzyme catalytic domain-containing protein [Penicillium taxi]
MLTLFDALGDDHWYPLIVHCLPQIPCASEFKALLSPIAILVQRGQLLATDNLILWACRPSRTPSTGIFPSQPSPAHQRSSSELRAPNSLNLYGIQQHFNMSNSVPDLDSLGIKAGPELADQFRHEVAKLLGRTNLNFPGAQPVSFSRKHLTELQQRDYYVCEKTDGIRCLMYFARGDPDSDMPEIHYLIDRKNDYRYVPHLHFPLPGDDTFQSYHVDTLVDGELVNDTFEDGTQQLKYLVFDCLVLDGQSLMHRTLDKRLAYFKEKVLKPYNAMYRKFPEEKQHRAFAVEDKSTQFSYGIEMMFRDIIPKVKCIHGNDGLIFTCRSTPYRNGTDEHILKWKPPSENTVDFRMRLEFPVLEPDSDDEAEGVSEPFVDYEAMPIFHLFVAINDNKYRDWGEMYVTPAEWEDMKALKVPLDDSIVECYQDEHNRWRFHRLRDDKVDANYITTVEKVLESIEDRVTEEDLIRLAPVIKNAWKKRQAQMAAEEEERKRKARGMPQSMNGNGVKRKFEDGQN